MDFVSKPEVANDKPPFSERLLRSCAVTLGARSHRRDLGFGGIKFLAKGRFRCVTSRTLPVPRYREVRLLIEVAVCASDVKANRFFHSTVVQVQGVVEFCSERHRADRAGRRTHWSLAALDINGFVANAAKWRRFSEEVVAVAAAIVAGCVVVGARDCWFASQDVGWFMAVFAAELAMALVWETIRVGGPLNQLREPALTRRKRGQRSGENEPASC